MLKITYQKVADLIPYEKNPRINDNAIEPVANSIKEFGFRVPIVIDENRVIITGHTRLAAAKFLKMEEVPCIIASDLSPEQIQAYRIADNKTGEIAEWNYELLPLELRELQESEFDLSLLGFDTEELDRMLNGSDDKTVTEGETEADAVPEVPEIPKSKRGEKYQLGNHILLCGDSTVPEDIAKLMGDEQADLYLVDPPYNVALEGSNGLTIQNDNMSDSKFREFLTKAFSCAADVLKPGSAFYIFHSDSESCNFRLASGDTDLEVHQTLYWVKNAFVLGRFDYHYQSESCLYGWKPGAAHRWYSDRCQTNILNFDKPKHNDVHPSMKPVDMLVYLLQNPAQTDGKALFHNSHRNILTGASSALSADSLKKAVQLYLDQTDADGQPISVEPRYLLVPTALKHLAIELTRGATLVMSGGTENTVRPAINVLADENLQVVSSPYLGNAAYDGSSQTAWYLFGDPRTVDTFELGFLKGKRTPTIERGETDFNTLGMWFRVYFDIGVREQDFRGMVKANGAA